MDINYFKNLAGSILFLTLFVSVVSCQNLESDIQGDESIASVSVNLVSVGSNTESLKSAQLVSVDSDSSLESLKPIIIPFNDDYAIVATLEQENLSQSASESEASSSTRATAVSQNLDSGVKYRALVYDSQGKFVAYKDFAYGNESAVGSFMNLTVGKTYTFVVYSVNSTTSLPDISLGDSSTLANAKIVFSSFTDKGSDQFMYYIKQLTVQQGTNYLDVALAHQFSQITTKLAITGDALTQGAYLVSISNPRIAPMATSATVSLKDGTIAYGSDKSTGRTVVFPSFSEGTQSITSDSTSLVHAATSAAAFYIDALTIRGDVSDSRTDITKAVTVSNLKITPGYRYNLNLNIDLPCVKVVEVTKDFSWKYSVSEVGPKGSQIVSRDTLPAADYGFVFDLDSLDNSFMLEINGVKIATQELQLQNTAGLTQNVQFADGSYWNNGTVPNIWNIFGNRKGGKPSFRITVDTDGVVSVFGSKYSASSANWGLYPIVFTASSGGKFNTVIWNKDSPNVVTVRQTVEGQTWFAGGGRGYKLVTTCSGS
ncbi:MAG: hypothetical protein H6Q14_1426 [Bacteroidetes bacterium]|nr:hypothetical protein [Bacteroidota bacterium]